MSYANSAMSYSLKRIGKQAESLGIFDEVRLYTPDDLPHYVKGVPELSAPRGAGYMIWKPIIIYETIKGLSENDVVVFVDAGCTLRESSLWSMLFRLMKKYETVCFQYEKEQPQWAKYGMMDSLEGTMTKKTAIDFLEKRYCHESIKNVPQIMTGMLFFRNKENEVLNRWKNIAVSYPGLFADPTDEEIKDQYPEFVVHRHDQSIFTALAYNDPNTLVLPEISEQYTPDAFVYGSRIRAANFVSFLLVRVKQIARRFLGDKIIDGLKRN